MPLVANYDLSNVSTSIFYAGVTTVSSNQTISTPITMLNGATFNVASGVTLTITGYFSAPLAQVFTGAGTVVFGVGNVFTAYPEWWGAITGSSSGSIPANNLIALQAAVSSGVAIIQLQGLDYWISSTWVINTSGITVQGVNYDGYGSAPITRVLTNSATIDIIQIGPNSQPNAGSDVGFMGLTTIQNITVTRNANPTPPSSGFNGPSGFRFQWIEGCTFVNLYSQESTNGFYIKGTVFNKFNECHAYRSRVGSTSTNDYFCGFLQDNSPNIGLNSGNASLYINLSGAVSGSPGPSSGIYGIYSIGGFTDTFVWKFETSGIQYGLVFNGVTTGSLPYPAEDLSIMDCTIDGPIVGITINSPGSGSGGVNNTAVLISGNYIGIANSTATSGILINASIGAISIMGNQIIGGTANLSTVGINIESSSGVISVGNIITDCGAPIVLNAANSCRITDMINAQQSGLSGTNAVLLVSSGRNVIDVTLTGVGTHYTNGVNLSGTGNGYNECRMTGINPGILTTLANKLVSNGAQITTSGTFGSSNLASGIIN